MKRPVIFFLTILMHFAAFSQNWADVKSRDITTIDGLPSNTVRNIVQDKFGYIWFGTDKGLCRYDGAVMRQVRLPERDAGEYVSALISYGDGLLVGTGAGVYIYSSRYESLQRAAPAITSTVFSIAADKNGTIWISTLGQGVFKITTDRLPVGGGLTSEKLKTRNYPFKDHQGQMAQVYVDNNNQIWALVNGAGHPVYRYNKAKDIFMPFPIDGDERIFHSLSMTETHDGTIWLGTWDNGLVKLGAGGQTEEVLNPNVTGVGHHIHRLNEVKPGILMIGCDDGLIEYNTSGGSWKRVCGDNLHSTEAGRFVYSVITDNEGGLWYGTFYGGVAYLSPFWGRFATYRHDITPNLSGNVISRFCEENADRIWIASDDGGLNQFVPSRNACVTFPGKTQLERCNIHALSVDGDNLWIGTYTDGVIRMKINNGQTRRYTMYDGLDDSSCYAIYKDGDGTLWATTMNGICRYDYGSDRFEPVLETGVLTIDITDDSHGNVWFATQGGGLWRYIKAAGKWKNYKPGGAAGKLPDNQVNSLSIDMGGRLWVATSVGLCYYEEKSDSFIQQEIDMPSHDISCIIPDDNGLWLATTQGLVRYISTDSLQIFNRHDGLANEQFQTNSCIKASDGRIYLGTVSGFNAFYPYQVKVNDRAPQVYITDMELSGRDIDVGSKYLPEALSMVDKIDLSYKDDMISFTFASLSYCSPEKNAYAYKLDGFDKQWNYIGNRRRATYTNLPPGTYTLRVKATNNDGVWSGRDATLKIVVHPPFYWSWPAKALYLLLLIGGIYTCTQFRLRKAEKRHKNELQRLSERQAAEEQKARLKFFTMVAHEIRTPVSLIIGPLENVTQKLNNSSAETSVSKDLNIIERNANRLLDLVNQLLDFNKIRRDGMEMRLASYNISKLMQAVAERFEPTFSKKGVTFTVNYPPPDFTAVVDKEGLTKIISNLMTNATKYTAGSIILSCVIQVDSFVITVEDNGVGISKDEQKKIFADFYQAHDNKPGTGLGLSIVSKIVSLLGGTVRVESEEGKGARFIVTLPTTQPERETRHDNSEDGDDEQPPAFPTIADTAIPSDTSSDDDSGETVPDSVLIVEDDEDMRNFLSSNFESSYIVYTAENGREAIEQLRRHTVTLIVSDWMMPEIDGVQLCRMVRADKDTSHIPFIMLTAKTDNDSKTESMDCGADAYIEKPFSMKYLEACIRNMIEMRRLLMSKFATHNSLPITSIAKSEVDNNLLTRMNKVIEENINNSQLSVTFLAEQLGISRSGLFAKIKSLANVTPNEMIQVVRLKKAARLMTENKYRVNEIAYMVGFSSPSYFTKCFYKQFGMKPADYIASNK